MRASPGTITGVITLAVVHTKLRLPVTALVAVAVATLIMWLVMVLVGRRESHAGDGFVRDMATRFMGLIVIAMGTQFTLTGFRDFFCRAPLVNHKSSDIVSMSCKPRTLELA